VGILKRGVDSLPPDFGGGFDAFGVVYPIILVFTTMKELENIDDVEGADGRDVETRC
jgi:hypothetical protein